MACTNLNNPNSSEGPPGPRRSTNEYRRNNKKKILSLAKDEGRLILRNVAIRLRRPHKRRGPLTLSSLQKKIQVKIFSFCKVR
jgi:ribosomal protein L18E